MIDVKEQDRQVLDSQLSNLIDDEAPDPSQLIVCSVCSHVVTQQPQAIEVLGKHQHSCTNPHGFAYLVDCYGQALGCDILGVRHHADSWFAGYHWRIAACADCQQHLGWYFDRDLDQADDFFLWVDYGSNSALLNRLLYVDNALATQLSIAANIST